MLYPSVKSVLWQVDALGRKEKAHQTPVEWRAIGTVIWLVEVDDCINLETRRGIRLEATDPSDGNDTDFGTVGLFAPEERRLPKHFGPCFRRHVWDCKHDALPRKRVGLPRTSSLEAVLGRRMRHFIGRSRCEKLEEALRHSVTMVILGDERVSDTSTKDGTAVTSRDHQVVTFLGLLRNPTNELVDEHRSHTAMIEDGPLEDVADIVADLIAIPAKVEQLEELKPSALEIEWLGLGDRIDSVATLLRRTNRLMVRSGWIF